MKSTSLNDMMIGGTILVGQVRLQMRKGTQVSKVSYFLLSSLSDIYMDDQIHEVD